MTDSTRSPLRARLCIFVERFLVSPLPLIALLGLAAYLRWLRLELRFNQITFAYAAYFEPYLEALDHRWTHALTTFIGLHPPLYSAVFTASYRLWGALAGYHVVSGAISVGAVAVTYLMAREAFDRKVALMAAALLSVSVYHLHYSLELNNYPLLVLTSAMAQWAFIRLLKKPAGFATIFWVLSIVSCLYTHALGALLLAVQLVVFIKVFGVRTLGRLLVMMAWIGLLTFPMVRPVLGLVSRGSTYHNEARTWIELWPNVGHVMLTRFGPEIAVWLLWMCVGLGVLRVCFRARQKAAGAALALTLLCIPVILELTRLGVAASHQYPYYLLILPTLVVLAARGLVPCPCPPPAIPDSRNRIAGLSLLLFLCLSQLLFARAEQAEAREAGRDFENHAHAIRVALLGAQPGDVLWLIAPPLFQDDDKRAVDPVYLTLPRWERCTFYRPMALDFEYVDYSFGQPEKCGESVYYSFTDIYPPSMARILYHHKQKGDRLRVVLYDYEVAADYPERLEKVLKPFGFRKRVVGDSLLYLVER